MRTIGSPQAHRIARPRRLALTVLGMASLGAACPSRAGLAEWLHGTPPPRPKAPPPDEAAAVNRAVGVAPDAQVEEFLRALAAAIKARDGKPLLPRLAERYTIDELPSGAKASDFLLQAVEQIPGADEILIRSIAAQGDMRVVQTDFRYPKDLIRSKIFRFDAAGRLLASDLFQLKRQGPNG